MTSVTLGPPGTGKRCTLNERPSAGSVRRRRERGESGVWRDDVVALGWEGNTSVEERDGGEW